MAQSGRLIRLAVVTMLAAAVMVPLGAAPLATAYSPAEQIGKIAAAELGEISGMALSRQNPGIVWVHNDSGDGAYVYAIDVKGDLKATCLVRSASAIDWEDMAAGPGPDGTGQFLYIGDIGDNDRERTDCVVYRTAEPKVGDRPSSRDAPVLTAEPVRRSFAYPDGPHDAETLLVHPKTGDIYIVTKEPEGKAQVFKFPPESKEYWRRAKLQKVGELSISGVLPLFRVLTGGDISPDGRRVILRSYEVAYELRLPAGSDRFDDIWEQKPKRISTPPMDQGEAICYGSDGASLLLTSEKLPAPLFLMRAQ